MNSTKTKNIELINKKYGRNYQNHFIEQYKIFVESSERITEKRMNTNKFYLALNSLLFGLATYISFDKNIVTIILSGIGILISFIWKESISSYKELNSAKFKVILDMEKYLPACPFKKEDEHLKGYYKITKLEKFVPIIFIILYIILIIVSIIFLIVKI